MSYLVVEEVDGVFVQPEGEGLEEWDVVGHDLLVREVELVNDDRVDVVVGQQIIWNYFEISYEIGHFLSEWRSIQSWTQKKKSD